MNELFIKQKNKYSKGNPCCFYKLTEDGRIVSISPDVSIRKPKSIQIFSGCFEIVSREQFEKEMKLMVEAIK